MSGLVDDFLRAVRAASAADGMLFCDDCGTSLGDDGPRDADGRTIHRATCQRASAAAARAAELQEHLARARNSATHTNPKKEKQVQERNNELLQAVVNASQVARDTKATRDDAIRAARREGFTLRQVAEASGLANQTVRRICGAGAAATV